MTRGVSIIIPAFNEAATLKTAVQKVLQVDLRGLNLKKEIIVVDDGSTDETRGILEALKKNGINVLRHEDNRGKGMAIQTGLKESAEDIVLIQDADLEYNPQDYKKLLEPITAGVADVVYGSRFVGSSPHRVLFFWHYFGNKIITFLTNLVANLNLTDIETGFKAFRREAILSVKLKEARFGFEPEVTIKLARGRWRFYEVGISYYARDYSQGKKIRWTDGLLAIWTIMRLSPGLSIVLALILIVLFLISL